MSTVCLDNNILVLAIRGAASNGQENMIARAQALIAAIERQRDVVIVPAVVVGEFLAGIPVTEHKQTLQVLTRRFQIPSYDARAAAIAARIWRERAGQMPSANDLLREIVPDIKNAKIKSDIQILATAIANRATTLFTHDKALIALAKYTNSPILICDLPPVDQNIPGLLPP